MKIRTLTFALIVFSSVLTVAKAKSTICSNHIDAHTDSIILKDTINPKIRIVSREKYKNYSSSKEGVTLNISIRDGNHNEALLPYSFWALFDKNGKGIELSSTILQGKVSLDIKSKNKYFKLKIGNMSYHSAVEISLKDYSNEFVNIEVLLFEKEVLLH